MSHRRTIIGVLAGVAATSIWGGMYVVSDIVLEVIPPFTLLTVRLLIAIPILALAQRSVGWPRLERRDLLRLLGVGAIGLGVSVGAQFVGTKLSTAANGALITSTTPVFVALFAVWLLREKLTIYRVVALALTVAGAVIVINPAQANLVAGTQLGNVVLLVAALTWGLYSVLVKWATRANSSLTVSMVAMVGGLLLAGLVVPFEVTRTPIGTLTTGIGLGVLYLGVVSTAVAMFLWTRAFELLDAGLAGLTIFAQPVVGAVLGVLLLGEALSSGFFVGGALILVGVALVSLFESRQAPVRADATS